jgi:hypothetical protein
MGVYALSSKYHDNNKPVYEKMEASGKVDKYLYYMTSYRMWVIGKQLAKAPFDMAVESSADVPSKVALLFQLRPVCHHLIEWLWVADYQDMGDDEF